MGTGERPAGAQQAVARLGVGSPGSAGPFRRPQIGWARPRDAPRGGGQLYECRLGLRRRAIWWTSRKAGITRPRRSNPLLEHASKTPGACPRTGTDSYPSSVPSVEDTRSGTASPYALNTQTEYQQAAAHFRARATSPNPMNPSSAAPGAGTMSNRMVLCAVTSNFSEPCPMATAQ